MSDLAKRLARNAALKPYLDQLRELVGSEVTEQQLSSLEEVQRLKKVASQFNCRPKKVIKIAPEDLTRERFKLLVHALAKANPSPVSIWLNATASCGTLFLSRIDEFNFGFQYDAIPEGVVVLLTKDGNDKLLIDINPDEAEVELQGERWGNVEY
jgi:hypothetical protein